MPMANTQGEGQGLRRKPWRVAGIILLCVAVGLGVGYWLVQDYLFPVTFTPVQLSASEQQQLDAKLARVSRGRAAQDSALEPEPYREAETNREIHFTERELNALLAHNTDLANRLAIDLSDNLASARLLIDLDPELPLFGGKTLKVTAGMALYAEHGQPRAVLEGVSIWGVPLPNAWLGNLKQVDLIKEFGNTGGFWQAVQEGVEHIEVREGALILELKK